MASGSRRRHRCCSQRRAWCGYFPSAIGRGTGQSHPTHAEHLCGPVGDRVQWHPQRPALSAWGHDGRASEFQNVRCCHPCISRCRQICEIIILEPSYVKNKSRSNAVNIVLLLGIAVDIVNNRTSPNGGQCGLLPAGALADRQWLPSLTSPLGTPLSDLRSVGVLARLPLPPPPPKKKLACVIIHTTLNLQLGCRRTAVQASQ